MSEALHHLVTAPLCEPAMLWFLKVHLLVYVLDGNECRRANKLDKTIDSAILLTQSWLDVTIFTTCKLINRILRVLEIISDLNQVKSN